MKRFAAALILAASPALADGHSTVYAFDGSFDDATFAVESAILDRGLVIDYVSHTGEMLARTGADLGSDVTLFDDAQIFVFCSAVVSRKVMEADPSNIAFCPYSVFVSDRAGQVEVGFRNYPDGPMQEVQTLLNGILADAIAN